MIAAWILAANTVVMTSPALCPPMTASNTFFTFVADWPDGSCSTFNTKPCPLFRPVFFQGQTFAYPSECAPYVFSWNFGDGQNFADRATAVGQAVSHEFTYPGHYTVSMTASNAYETFTTSQTVEVIGEWNCVYMTPHTLFILYVADGARAGVPIPFSLAPTTYPSYFCMDPTRFEWDFGDGTPLVTTFLATFSPKHVYAAAGPYVVKVKITNDAQSLQLTTTVNVGPPIVSRRRSARH